MLISSAGVYDNLRGILNDGKLDVRVQYMIEVMFTIRKDGFKVRTIGDHVILMMTLSTHRNIQ